MQTNEQGGYLKNRKGLEETVLDTKRMVLGAKALPAGSITAPAGVNTTPS